MSNLRIDYDPHTDILTIEGVKYSGCIFRNLGLAPEGTWLRINERDKCGTLTLQNVHRTLAKQFDDLAGLGRP